jgi:hypothetical protein
MGDIIRANEVEDFRALKSTGIIPDGVNRVGDAAALDFLFIHIAPGFPGEGQSQEAQAFAGVRRFAIWFERRLGGGDEEESR